MGWKIEHDKKYAALERRLKLVEDALEEFIQTRVHHIDLHEEVKPVGVEVAPDKVTNEKTKKKKAKKETVSA